MATQFFGLCFIASVRNILDESKKSKIATSIFLGGQLLFIIILRLSSNSNSKFLRFSIVLYKLVLFFYGTAIYVLVLKFESATFSKL